MRNKLAWPALLALLQPVWVAAQASPASLDSAVVQIQVMIAGKPPQPVGTGFFAERDDIIVTADHVYLGAEATINDSRDGMLMAVRQSAGKSFFAPAELAAHDPQHDIALLRVDPRIVKAEWADFPAKPLRLAEREPEVGAEVAFAGFFGSDTMPMFIRGVVAGRTRPAPAVEELVIEAPANQGQSGSPLVLASTGDVVGLMVTYVPVSLTPGVQGNSGLSRAAKVEYVSRLLATTPTQSSAQRSVEGASPEPRKSSHR
jgi:S1-C subfamily serine protease